MLQQRRLAVPSLVAYQYVRYLRTGCRIGSSHVPSCGCRRSGCRPLVPAAVRSLINRESRGASPRDSLRGRRGRRRRTSRRPARRGRAGAEEADRRRGLAPGRRASQSAARARGARTGSACRTRDRTEVAAGRWSWFSRARDGARGSISATPRRRLPARTRRSKSKDRPWGRGHRGSYGPFRLCRGGEGRGAAHRLRLCPSQRSSTPQSIPKAERSNSTRSRGIMFSRSTRRWRSISQLR